MAIVLNQVMADAINEKLGVALKMKSVAVDCTEYVDEILEYGNEVNFPTFSRIGESETVEKGVALTPDEVNMTENKAEIMQTGKAVRIYDKDKAQIKGKVVDAMAEQISEVMASRIDSEIANEMIANAVYKTPMSGATPTITEMDAIFDVWGDQVKNSSFAGIIAHGSFRSAITRLDEFSKADRTYAVAGNGYVDDENCIGFWNGTIPVYLSNKMVDVANNNEPVLAVVKKNALGYIMQKETTLEEEREGKLLATDLISSNLFAVKLLDSKGVSLLKATVA